MKIVLIHKFAFNVLGHKSGWKLKMKGLQITAQGFI